MIKISPSILSADFANLGSQIQILDSAGADLIHIDIMDGNFVPNITFGFPIMKSIRPYTSLPFDVHLMIEDPSRYIEDFVSAGANIITVHYESVKHLDRLIDQIKSFNTKAGIAINPATPISAISPLLHKIDMILVMSVNPGYGGQKFIQYTLEKVKQLHLLKIDNSYNYSISIDGGVDLNNLSKVAAAGVDIVVSGSAVFQNGTIKKNIAAMKKIAESIER